MAGFWDWLVSGAQPQPDLIPEANNTWGTSAGQAGIPFVSPLAQMGDAFMRNAAAGNFAANPAPPQSKYALAQRGVDTGPAPQVVPDAGASIASMIPGKGLYDLMQAGVPLIDPTTGRPDPRYTQGSFNTALGLTGIGAPLAEEGAAGMAGGRLRAEKSNLSNLVHQIPLGEMSATRLPAPGLSPALTVNPETLQGGLLMPLVGDRTLAGHTLTGINESPLAYPVPLEGGPTFMRGPSHAADQSVWASGPGVITNLNKIAATASERAGGAPVYGVYTSMGGTSGDYSHMMSDALLSQIRANPPAAAAAGKFNDAMRELHPDWPGLKSPRLQDALNENGLMRKNFAETVDTAPFQARDARFPDIHSTRAAITDPALLNQPTGMSGYAIGRIDPGRIINDPAAPHRTYATQLGGQYMGGLPVQVPRHVMWPDYAAENTLKPGSSHELYSFERKKPVQLADQQWLDNVMKYITQQQR